MADAARKFENTYEYDNEAFVTVVTDTDSDKRAVITEINRKRERTAVKNLTCVKVVGLIILGMIVALRFASITEINYRNQALTKELNTAKSAVTEKQVDIESRMSISEIAKIAEERLNMQKPQPYQIVKIEVEPVDRTEASNPVYTSDTSELPWYKTLWNNVLEFLGLIGA